MKKPLLFVLVVAALAGCTTHSARKAKPEQYSITEPRPTGFSRSQQVSDRASELVQSGKYSDRRAAYKAADKEIPFDDSGETAWASRQAIAWKQKAAQDKFENDLGKIIGK